MSLRPKDAAAILSGAHFAFFVISTFAYVAWGLIWTSEFQARDFTSWQHAVVPAYLAACFALGVLTLLAGLAVTDRHAWGIGASYAYCALTIVFQIGFFFVAEALFDDERFGWQDAYSLGAAITGAYCSVLLIFLVANRKALREIARHGDGLHRKRFSEP